MKIRWGTFISLIFTVLIFGCSMTEDLGEKPVLEEFYISWDRDINGTYNLKELDVGYEYCAMLKITDEDKDVVSASVTQKRKSDGFLIGPNTIAIPAVKEKTFFGYTNITPDLEGEWEITVNVKDSKGNVSNTKVLDVIVYISNKYEISFDGNGADSGTMQTQILYTGQGTVLSKNIFEKEGFIFSHWNTERDGSGFSYNNEAAFTPKYKGNVTTFPHNFTLYAQWLDLKTITDDLICVDGGTFSMGYTGVSSYLQSQYPAHDVTVNSFYMEKYELSRELYYSILGKDFNIGDKNYPIAMSWRNAIAFCNYLTNYILKESDCVYYSDANCTVVYSMEDASNKIVPYMNITKKGYRLPTEAEWEYAAKGGKNKDPYIYSGSDDYNEVAWVSQNSSNGPHACGLKAPNSLGIYDMSGNYAEWCWDTYAKYTSEAQVNPTGAEKKDVYNTIYKGRSYDQEGPAVYYRDTFYSAYEGHTDSKIGIRLVRTK